MPTTTDSAGDCLLGAEGALRRALRVLDNADDHLSADERADMRQALDSALRSCGAARQLLERPA